MLPDSWEVRVSKGEVEKGGEEGDTFLAQVLGEG